MERFHLRLAAVAVTAACFGGGYGMAKIAGNSGQERQAAKVESRTSSTSNRPRSRTGNSSRSGGNAIQRNPKLKALAAIGDTATSGFLDRYRAHLRMISIADVSEFESVLVQLETEMPNDLGGNTLRDFLIKRWTEEDPMGALDALVSRQPPSLEQDENTILEQALNNDREGVLKALGTVEPWGRRHELLGLALADIAGNEPEEAIAIARQLGPPAQYSKVWEDLLGQLTVYPDGEELFLSIAAELPPSMLSETYYAQVFDTLANLDRERALALLVQIPHAAHRREAIDALSQKFSADEMDEAVAWAQGLPSASERDRALRNILANTARARPEEAHALFNQLSMPERVHIAGTLAQSWFGHDREAALTWIDTELEGPARQRALTDVLRWRHESLSHEEQLVIANQTSGVGQARSEFVQRWAGRDAEAALEWTNGRPGPEAQMFHLYAVRGWYEKSPRAAIEHVSALEASGLRNNAVSWLAALSETDRGVRQLIVEIEGEDGELVRAMESAGPFHDVLAEGNSDPFQE